MNKINHTDFMKKVFKKGKFEQYSVSPYASTENHFQNVLLLSDKVEEPTYYCYRKKVIALIIPFKGSLANAIKENEKVVKDYTGVGATYFGVFDLTSKRKVLVF